MVSLNLVKTEDEFQKVFGIFAEMYPHRNDFNDFAGRWNNSQTHIYFIEENNEICGYVLITTRNEIGYMVSPKFQRGGIGRKAITKLMELEPREYYWATVPKENEDSMNFIQSFGFVPRGIMYGFDPPKK
jgi:RimJ/RimL family protein N-acetyltransferase